MSIRTTNEEIIQAYFETGSVWKAAKRLGLCGQSVHERLRRLGIRMSLQAWTQDDQESARSLAEQGTPIGMIAERLGRTYAAVACELSRMGVPHPYLQSKPRQVKRGSGLTKKRLARLLREADSSRESLRRVARKLGVTTSGLTNALQSKLPVAWAKYTAAHSLLSPRICPGCQGQFVPLTAKQRFCTGPCATRARSDKQYFGGKRNRTIGLAEGVCQLCEERKKPLSSHHIFGKKNDPENDFLIALCSGCHQLVSILGRRKDGRRREFWENLIILATSQALGGRDPKPLGFHVMVDIDELDREDVDEVYDGKQGALDLEEPSAGTPRSSPSLPFAETVASRPEGG